MAGEDASHQLPTYLASAMEALKSSGATKPRFPILPKLPAVCPYHQASPACERLPHVIAA